MKAKISHTLLNLVYVFLSACVIALFLYIINFSSCNKEAISKERTKTITAFLLNPNSCTQTWDLKQKKEYENFYNYLNSKFKENKKKFKEYKNAKFDKNLGKALVVYYSYTGMTEKVAKAIKLKLNADIFEIKITKLNSALRYYQEVNKVEQQCYLRYLKNGDTNKNSFKIYRNDIVKNVKKLSVEENFKLYAKMHITLFSQAHSYFEQAIEGTLPSIETAFPDISEYDIVFVGTPVWCTRAPPPVISFLKAFDFANKPVCFFSTSMGVSNGFFDFIGKNAKNAKIIDIRDFFDVYDYSSVELNSEINYWLNYVEEKLNAQSKN
ncbi:MAG: hypothetical protein LBU55_04270 [Elusimicrobiota bacterium]|jgi:flavodoxin|nr:hypothetical protein [Elusimicrobiota bacterium]